MAASVMCNFAINAVGAIRPCSHQSGSSSFPAKVVMMSTTTRGCSPSASQTVQSQSALVTHEVDSLATVFSDETKGIVCYRSESGEVTCEGLDEGPCFYPHSAQLSQQLLLAGMCLPDIRVPRPFAFSAEDVKDICLKEYMGTMVCEGRDEC